MKTQQNVMEQIQRLAPIVIFLLLLQSSVFPFQFRSKGYSSNQSIQHAFSDLNEKDTFTLTVNGPNIFESNVIFHIVSRKGRIIYTHRFTVGELMERDYKKDNRSMKDSSSIEEVLASFFNENNFHPAHEDLDEITNEHYDGLGIDWKEFQNDTTAVGFHYLLGAEDGRFIGFSKKKNKTVVYLRCC